MSLLRPAPQSFALVPAPFSESMVDLCRPSTHIPTMHNFTHCQNGVYDNHKVISAAGTVVDTFNRSVTNVAVVNIEIKLIKLEKKW